MLSTPRTKDLPLVMGGKIERRSSIERSFASDVIRYVAVEPVEISIHDQLIYPQHVGRGSMNLNRQVVVEFINSLILGKLVIPKIWT